MDQITLRAELAQVRSSLARLAAKANYIASHLHEIARALSGSWGQDEHIELVHEDLEFIRTDTSLTLERGVVGRLLAEIADLRFREFAILRQLEPSKAVRRAKPSEIADSSSAGVRLPRRRAKCAGGPSFAREAE
jgi:voltage-gated potassium channel Kch